MVVVVQQVAGSATPPPRASQLLIEDATIQNSGHLHWRFLYSVIALIGERPHLRGRRAVAGAVRVHAGIC
jgi:hypothetical protein